MHEMKHGLVVSVLSSISLHWLAFRGAISGDERDSVRYSVCRNVKQ